MASVQTAPAVQQPGTFIPGNAEQMRQMFSVQLSRIPLLPLGHRADVR